MLPFSFTMTIGSSVSAGALTRRIFLGFSCFIPPLNPNVRRGRRKKQREREREREREIARQRQDDSRGTDRKELALSN